MTTNNITTTTTVVVDMVLNATTTTTVMADDITNEESLSSSTTTATTIPWNVPRIRTWEITENSTRYDKLVAAPSDDDMIKMWYSWSAIMAVTSIFTVAVFIGILSNQKTRRNPFNRYLLYLMIPDLIMSIPCGITCFLNGLAGQFRTETACKAQSVYFIFGIAANAWLNAVICRQLYLMLTAARHFRRYSPPTVHKVTIDAIGVYVWAFFVASLGIWDQSWLPHKTWLVNGTACVPMDYNVASTLFFYLIFFPALLGAPMGYVAYVGYQIYKHDLLPPTGKRRVLSIYFLRLATVFVIMWLPALLFFFILGAWMGHWVLWAGGAWSHLQGGVSAAASLWKPDISKSVKEFWTCQLSNTNEDDTVASSSNARPSSRISSRLSFYPPTTDGGGGGIMRRLTGVFTLSNFTMSKDGLSSDDEDDAEDIEQQNPRRPRVCCDEQDAAAGGGSTIMKRTSREQQEPHHTSSSIPNRPPPKSGHVRFAVVTIEEDGKSSSETESMEHSMPLQIEGDKQPESEYTPPKDDDEEKDEELEGLDEYEPSEEYTANQDNDFRIAQDDELQENGLDDDPIEYTKKEEDSIEKDNVQQGKKNKLLDNDDDPNNEEEEQYTTTKEEDKDSIEKDKEDQCVSSPASPNTNSSGSGVTTAVGAVPAATETTMPPSSHIVRTTWTREISSPKISQQTIH